MPAQVFAHPVLTSEIVPPMSAFIASTMAKWIIEESGDVVGMLAFQRRQSGGDAREAARYMAPHVYTALTGLISAVPSDALSTFAYAALETVDTAEVGREVLARFSDADYQRMLDADLGMIPAGVAALPAPTPAEREAIEEQSAAEDEANRREFGQRPDRFEAY